MSNFPTIPEFVGTPQEMSTALRAVKQAFEQLAGLRQGEARGAPQMFVQGVEPDRAKRILYKIGDLWINTQTNKLHFWAGTTWQEMA